MSLFPNSRTYYHDRQKLQLTDADFNALHWTVQQQLKPNSRQPKPYRETGDFDNRIDNFDDPETYDEPQVNE